MNIKVISWLLKHRELLLAVVAAAKKFRPDGSYMSKWDVADEIARLVIPVFEKEGVDAFSMLTYDFENDEVSAFALGAEVQALGVDWQALIQIVLPLLIAILKALSPDE